jgi:hypothetical protein
VTLRGAEVAEKPMSKPVNAIIAEPATMHWPRTLNPSATWSAADFRVPAAKQRGIRIKYLDFLVPGFESR